MLNKPQWKASFLVQPIDEESVLLVDELDSVLLTGRMYVQIAPYLDGSRTILDLLQIVPDAPSYPEMFYALLTLEQRGLVREGNPEVSSATAAFWDTLQIPAHEAQLRLRAAKVHLLSPNGIPLEPFEAALHRCGIATSDEGAATLTVAVVNDYLEPSLSELSRTLRAAHRAWMPVKPVGNVLWLGPVFGRPEDPCLECLTQRIRSNRQVEAFLDSRGESRGPLVTSLASMPCYLAVAANLVTGEAVKWLARPGSSAMNATVLSLNTLTLETEKHAVIKRPQCPVCGVRQDRDRQPQPVLLSPCLKQFQADGGHRAVSPEATWKRLGKHVSSISGVVTTLTDLTPENSDGMTYSYSAGHNFALLGKDLLFLMHNLRGRSGGKGATEMQAKVSAICEAIERYSGVYRGDEPSHRASFTELGADAVHPGTLMNFSPCQYKHRLQWNQQHESAYHRVPVPLDVDRPIDWTPVWSLTEARQRWVPAAYCYYGHPDLPQHFFTSCDANGSAAGNTREEAILQGYFELVERDAVALWWYNRVRRPGVDLASFGDPYFLKLRESYASQGRGLWVLDITSDLAIPTFAAVSQRTGHPTEDIILGFGSHLDARVAVLRALTEVNQFLPSVSRRDEKGNTVYWFHERDAIRWWQTATLAGEPYLLPSETLPARRAADFTSHFSSDLRDDIQACVATLRTRGMEMLVLDQSQPDVELAVVKVMVPGMRHFWKRFGPGRLYDVPVQLGWLEAPRTEQELNPTGIFF